MVQILYAICYMLAMAACMIYPLSLPLQLKPVVQGCAAVAGVTDVNSEEDDPTNQDHPLAGMVTQTYTVVV